MTDKIVKSKYFLEEDFIETISEVSDRNEKKWGPNSELKFIGKPISRVDGDDKVSGKALYTFDVDFKNMAYAKFLEVHTLMLKFSLLILGRR